MPPEAVSNPPVPLPPVPLPPVDRPVDRSIDPPVDVWTPTPPTNLIFDDGEPLETHRHRLAMNVLIDAVNQALKDRTDFFAGGNMFVYFSDRQVFNKDFRGPDFFVALEVDGSQERQGWVTWHEGGRYPDVIIELLSPSTKAIDLGEKKRLYERVFHTTNYFVYDPFDPSSLQGWQLGSQCYQPLTPNPQGWLWCDVLQLWVGPWTGQLRREPANSTCAWLRFYSPSGDLIPLPEELAEQAQQQAEQAQQQAEIERQQAEIERQQAKIERQQAETERQRAEIERQQAETERQRADAAQQRALQLEAQLRALGIEPQG